MELTRPLSTVVFVEGKPQRPHRRLVALSSRPLVPGSSVVNSVGEQIPGRSRHWPNVSDVECQLPLIYLPSRAEQPVFLVVRCYVISQGAPSSVWMLRGRDDLTPDVAVGCHARRPDCTVLVDPVSRPCGPINSTLSARAASRNC
jgi:hypothetical protein